MPFLITFGIFIILGIILIILGLIGPGLAICGMGLFFYALILPQAAAAGRKYGMGGGGLLLKSATGKLAIPLDGISSASLLSKEESRRFTEELYRASVDAERNMDVGAWFKSKRHSADVIRYLSVTITGVDMRQGHSTNITSYAVKPEAELILLRLRNGRRILISPTEVRSFYSELLDRGVIPKPAAAGEGLSVQADIKPNLRGRRVLMISSFITFAVILCLVAVLVLYPAIKERHGAAALSAETAISAETAEDAAEAVLAAWLNDDSFIFGVLKDDLPEMERGGAVTAALFSDYAAPRLIWLYETGGELPEGSLDNGEAVERLGEFLILNSRMSFAGEEASDSGGVYIFFVVEQTGMKGSFASIIRNF